jgi:hypothetical protein
MSWLAALIGGAATRLGNQPHRTRINKHRTAARQSCRHHRPRPLCTSPFARSRRSLQLSPWELFFVRTGNSSVCSAPKPGTAACAASPPLRRNLAPSLPPQNLRNLGLGRAIGLLYIMATKTTRTTAFNSPHTAGIFSDMTVDGPVIGTLVAIIDRGRNLPNRRSMGKQDPYCAARLGKEAKKTTTDRRGGQTPRWYAPSSKTTALLDANMR